MPLSNLPPLQSQSAKFDEPGFEAVKADLQNLSVLAGQAAAMYHVTYPDHKIGH